MKTHVFLRDVLTEIKSGIGSDWAKYPVLGATRGDWPPRKNPRARIRSDTSPYFREPYFITRCVSSSAPWPLWMRGMNLGSRAQTMLFFRARTGRWILVGFTIGCARR